MTNQTLLDSELREKLLRLVTIEAAMSSHRFRFDESKKELTRLGEEYLVVRREVIEELTSRDVVQRGNTGWESRTVHFLCMLVGSPDSTGGVET